MASWREIERIRRNADAFRGMAARLLTVEFLTEWESVFLESVARKVELKEFSTRQAEKLLEIRDAYEIVETWRGFSVALLLRQVFEARLDLSDDDEQWIIALHERGADDVRRRDAARLARCAGQLQIIDDEAA